MVSECKVPGCTKVVTRKTGTRGWCASHYRRWRLYGDPTTPLQKNKEPLTFEWMKQQTVVTESGCWEWQKARNHAGYGITRTTPDWGALAHRVSWGLANGNIPDGMTIDHLCFNPPCINPDHLRLLSPSENSANQRIELNVGPKVEFCYRGHEYTAENTYTFIYKGPWLKRKCRKCRAINQAEYRRRQKERAS